MVINYLLHLGWSKCAEATNLDIEKVQGFRYPWNSCGKNTFWMWQLFLRPKWARGFWDSPSKYEDQTNTVFQRWRRKQFVTVMFLWSFFNDGIFIVLGTPPKTNSKRPYRKWWFPSPESPNFQGAPIFRGYSYVSFRVPGRFFPTNACHPKKACLP